MISSLDGLKSKYLYGKWSRIFYVVEKADWVIKRVGTYISRHVNDSFRVKARVVTDSRGLGNQILHFGSRSLYVPGSWRKIHPSNKIIFTWYHGKKDDDDPVNRAMIDELPDAAEICSYMHTTNDAARNRFIDWGIPEEKIVVIPLGVDLELFEPVSPETKRILRKQLGIPERSICIGSFQKDGVGWGEGERPKYVKGPDVLCDSLIHLSKRYPLFILLLGPARGYVKRRLEDAKIPYLHRYIEKYEDIPRYYHALDQYIVTARDEGGPKAIFECMATGVPLVTTDVGMAGDVIDHGRDGFIAEVENIDEIVRYCSEIIEDEEKAMALVSSGLNKVKAYGWETIAGLHYEKMYAKLLRK